MPIRYAIASGNWSNPAIWDGGVSVPGPADEVRSNGFTVTVDTSVTVINVGNVAESSPVVAVGGQFQLANGSTLTCTHATVGIKSGTASNYCVRFLLGAGNSATFVGAVVGAQSTGAFGGIEHAGAGGTLNVIGSISTGLTNSSTGLLVSGAGAVLNVTGNVTPSVSGSSNALHITGASTIVNITGNVTCGGAAGFNTSAVYATGLNCVTTIIGNVEGSSFNGSSITIVLGFNAQALTVYGTLTAKVWTAISALSSGFTCYFSGPFINSIAGAPAFLAYKWFWAPVLSPSYHSIPISSGLSLRTMYTADYASAFDQPAVANVRQGTVYGIGGALTGTLAVPPPGSVALGVPTDNTTGTAAITQQAIADAVGPLIAAYGS